MPGFKIMLDHEWAQHTKELKAEQAAHRKRVGQAVRKAALLAERELKLGIRNGAPGGQKFRPLDTITLFLRRQRSSKPLIDSGSLVGSIHTTFDKEKLSAFVGVHRSARGADGESLVNVAMVHEYGTKPFVIRVTPALRRLFWRLHLASQGLIRALHPNRQYLNHPGVPERPFMRPTIAAVQPKVEATVRHSLISTKIGEAPP